jgi:hypothetical protein
VRNNRLPNQEGKNREELPDATCIPLFLAQSTLPLFTGNYIDKKGWKVAETALFACKTRGFP